MHEFAPQVIRLLQKQCVLFGVDIENAQAIIKELTDAGLTTEEKRLLVELYPNILRQRYTGTFKLGTAREGPSLQEWTAPPKPETELALRTFCTKEFQLLVWLYRNATCHVGSGAGMFADCWERPALAAIDALLVPAGQQTWLQRLLW